MSEIDARFFHGSETDVFLLSVSANIRHGLPLSQDDRVAAAQRIFVTHAEWSDRMVASLTGLSPKRVAMTRRQVAAERPQPERRVGKDGRSRPVDGTQGRRLAAEIISRNPTASLRRMTPSELASVFDQLRRPRGRVRSSMAVNR
ncbi:hypothetical protein [Streptomyces sp. PanSC19]|uniref:hypothetical protein n=1 Tax=Streptomyces sp. PanSC19 TaxID=1520455 RepID=UPI00161CEF47|nr:hypothetical protein [Streptomyces sp. PanSC19]